MTSRRLSIRGNSQRPPRLPNSHSGGDRDALIRRASKMHVQRCARAPSGNQRSKRIGWFLGGSAGVGLTSFYPINPTQLLDFIGAPGRTRTSTMLPLPDFESGASTNSATGAGGGNIAAKRGGSTARIWSPRAPAKQAPFFRDEPQTHARARAGGPGLRGALLPSPRSLIRSCGSGSRVSLHSPGTRDGNVSHWPRRPGVARSTPAPALSPRSRALNKRSCRPGPRALAPARRPSGQRDPFPAATRPACPRGA
jgi:hypothetical protein